MGGATRFMTLLTAPFPPLRPSINLIHRRLSSLSIAPLRLHTFSSPPKSKTLAPLTSSCFHSQSGNSTFALQSSASQQQPQQHLHHPWPEWTNFLNFLSNGQGYYVSDGNGIPPEDAFVVYEKLTDDFVSAAAACIAFARARPDLIGLLSRGDIEAVVSNGTPFLFRSALDAARRMRAFLGTDGSNVSEVDTARTIDLMKYIISYASNPTVSSERNGLYSRELVDSSVRNLLHEMFTICGGVPTGSMPASGPKPFGQNIEMKRGDWICPKCTFMNFARNIKCLECEEPRPKRQLTGREWECPQCNFYNYGRNVVCLRCDCRRPGAPVFNNNYSQNIGTKLSPESSNPNHVPFDAFSRTRQTSEMDNGSRIDIQNNDREQIEKSERWFQRMAELQNVKDLPSAVSDEEFPEIMPMRKGENRFVTSKQKDRSLTSPQYKRQAAIDQANNTNFVPFVPFPPGYFAKQDSQQQQPIGSDSPVKDQNPVSSVNSRSPVGTGVSEVSRIHNQPTSAIQSSVASNTMGSNSRTGGDSGTGNASVAGNGGASSSRTGWSGSSLEGSAVKEPDPLDMSEEAKAERWFKRVAQIKDISELSQIPDEDFPSIMPMRKGVNRFVVSKRKTPLERRLTSQQYRRNLPIVTNDQLKEEGDNS